MKGLPEVLIEAVMSLHEKQLILDDWKRLWLKCWHQGPMLSPFLFVVVVDDVTELAEGLY